MARYSKPQQLQEVVKHQMGVWLSETPLQVKTDETWTVSTSAEDIISDV